MATGGVSVENLSVYIQPQCLIDTSETKLQVNNDTLKQIQLLDKPLVIVAIAGPYRTGKSYLLNRLAGVPNGFPIGGTVESKTKGIWVWVRHHPKNDNKYLLLLDTEGLGDAEKGDRHHDNQIFCLATMMSSMLIFNALGNINDTALDTISFITGISRHISTRGTDVGDDDDFDYYFPRFVYALRDFCLTLTINGEEVSEDDYLDHALQLKPVKDSHSKQFNEIRRCIRKYFTRRKCFTFDRPACRKVLQHIQSAEDASLSPDFLEEVEAFCKYVVDKSPEKKLDSGGNFNGRMWADLVKDLITAISDGAVPCISSTVQIVSQTENLRVAEEGIECYRQLMDSCIELPTEDDQSLSDIHFQCLKRAVALFVEKAVFDSENVYQIRMNEEIEKLFKEYIEKNRKMSRQKGLDCLEQLNREIAQKVKDGTYSRHQGHMEYQEDLAVLQRTYNAKTDLGVESSPVLLEFMLNKLGEGESIRSADKAISKRETEESERKQKEYSERLMKELKQREEQIRAEAEKEYQRAKELNTKDMMEKREAEIRNMHEKFQEMIEMRVEEATRLQREGYEKEAKKMEETIEELRDKKKATSKGRCTIL